VIAPLAHKIPQDSIKLPDTYCYLLCGDLLVAPIFEENGQTEVVFPAGANWVYYFNNSKVYSGGHRTFLTFHLNQTALFMKTNSVIALQS
jgi:alpha-glucosidase (family GH31 glycosyl hydrolase)